MTRVRESLGPRIRRVLAKKAAFSVGERVLVRVAGYDWRGTVFGCIVRHPCDPEFEHLEYTVSTDFRVDGRRSQSVREHEVLKKLRDSD